MTEPRKRRLWPWAIAGFAAIGLIAYVAAVVGLRRSEVAALALDTARETPELVERLGEPIRMGWSSQGQFVWNAGAAGTAHLSIPISGPKESGVLRIVGVKESGRWRLTSLQYYGRWDSRGLDLLH